VSEATAAALAAASATSICPQCGAGFRCGVEAGDGECWCMAMPPLLSVPAKFDVATGAAASCLCPDCLKRRLAAAAG